MSYLVYECILYNEDSSVDSWGVKTGRLLKTEVVDINSKLTQAEITKGIHMPFSQWFLNPGYKNSIS